VTQSEAHATTKPRRRRFVWIALACVAALLVVGAIALPRIARTYAEREARRRGIELEFQSLELGLGRVRLRGVRFSLTGVHGLGGTVETAAIDLAGLTPERVQGEGLTLDLSGTTFVPGVIAWARALPSGAALPTSTSVAHVVWRAGEATVELTGGTLDVGPEAAGGEAGSLRGSRARLGERDLGAVDVAFVVGASAAEPDGPAPSLAIGLGSAKVAAAPLRIEVRGAEASAPVRVTLEPTRVGILAAFAGVTLPPTSAVVGGSVELPLPDLERPSPIAGTVALTVDGWVPPHPKELDGIVFGDRTAVDGTFRVAEDRRLVDVDDLHVAAGALTLTGTAALRRPPGAEGHPHIQADLSGAIPCTLLAGSAASARLGKTLGDLAGDLARRTVTGSVAVRVRLEADASALGVARIEPSAVVHCKLRGF